MRIAHHSRRHLVRCQPAGTPGRGITVHIEEVTSLSQVQNQNFSALFSRRKLDRFEPRVSSISREFRSGSASDVLGDNASCQRIVVVGGSDFELLEAQASAVAIPDLTKAFLSTSRESISRARALRATLSNTSQQTDFASHTSVSRVTEFFTCAAGEHSMSHRRNRTTESYFRSQSKRRASRL